MLIEHDKFVSGILMSFDIKGTNCIWYIDKLLVCYSLKQGLVYYLLYTPSHSRLPDDNFLNMISLCLYSLAEEWQILLKEVLRYLPLFTIEMWILSFWFFSIKNAISAIVWALVEMSWSGCHNAICTNQCFLLAHTYKASPLD